jgi:SAM-dependent methyltransferase
MVEPTLLFALGAGQCGFSALHELLSRQPQTRITLEDPPVLPWDSDDREVKIRERIARIRKGGDGARLIGDIASFYLPYVATILDAEPAVKMVCLRAEASQIAKSFESFLDSTSRVRIHHWSDQLPAGWFHDPVWTRAFPKYKLPTRSEAIERYAQEYYEIADNLASRFGDQFKILDLHDLSDESKVKSLLAYVGIPESLQNVWVCPADRLQPKFDGSRRTVEDPYSTRKCVILVPFGMFIHQDCDNALKELERRGYEVRRVGGYAAIDQGRNQMATDALRDGFEETFWIDSDVGFHPDDVEKIRRHNLPIVCGIYPQKGKRALACHVAPTAPSVTFGQDGGLIEILYAGAGFLNIRREAYEKIQKDLQLKVCNERFGAPMIPFFHPLIREIEEAHWYLAEDYAFCERARMCGIPTYADTSVRLWHIGNYRYGWEDAGMDRPRYNSFSMHFKDTKAPRSETIQNSSDNILNLANRYPWPDSRPAEKTSIQDRVWILPSVRQALADTIKVDDQCIVELGCWIGRTTRMLSDLAHHSTVVCIDPWTKYPFAHVDSSDEHLEGELFDRFTLECWDIKDRVVPMRREYIDGLRELADSGVAPNVIFFNAITDCPELFLAICAALDLFPKTMLIGHCYDRSQVAKELQAMRDQRRLRLDTLATAWRIWPRNG